MKCEITGKEFQTLRGFLNHLRKFDLTSKEYYDKYMKKDGEDICNNCGVGTCKYKAFSYAPYCSTKCAKTSEEHIKAVSSRFKGENGEEKKTLAVKKRIDNLGGSYMPENRSCSWESFKDNCYSKGLDPSEERSRLSSEAASKRDPEAVRLATIRSMETKELTGKKGGRSTHKPYTLFGNAVSVQGYEPIVLDYLQEALKGGVYCEKGKVPIVKYNNDKNMYFPDIYIPSCNLLIEVKSSYTYSKHKSNTKAKAEACLDQGYNFALLVLSKSEARKRELDKCKKVVDLAISSQASNPCLYWYDEGSTTILYGVGSSDPKCRESLIEGL